MAGLWNAEHTLMQRYGVMRIYGRKAGDDHGRLEKPMLIVWLIAGIAYIGGYVDLQRLARKFGCRRHQRAQRSTARRPRLVAHASCSGSARFAGSCWSCAGAGRAPSRNRGQPPEALVRARYRRTRDRSDDRPDRRRRRLRRRARHRVLRRRAQLAAQAHGCIAGATATRTKARRAVAYSGYFVAIGLLVYFTKSHFDGRLYAFAVLFFGALHILYDGFVWKLRRPAVAASLGITPGG